MERKEIPGIIGIGAAVGKKPISNTYIANKIEKSPQLVQRLMRKVGIETRNWADDDHATSDLAIEAISHALKMANVEPRNLKAIWVGTMSSDYQGVPIAPQVQEKIGSPNKGTYIDLSAACVGFLHSLKMAYTDLTSPFGQGAPQAALGADVLSRYLDPNQRDTYILFGDGAGAAIVDLLPDTKNLFGRIAFQFGADGSHVEDLYIPAGGTKRPASIQTVTDKLHCIWMNGEVVKEHAINRMKECVEIVLKKADVKVGDILWLFSHQANLEIIDGVARDLGFPPERVYKNIDRNGNTSAASIPIALRDAHDEGKLLPDELIVVCSFGAGFEFGAAVIPTVGLPKRAPGQIVRSAIGKLGR